MTLKEKVMYMLRSKPKVCPNQSQESLKTWEQNRPSQNFFTYLQQCNESTMKFGELIDQKKGIYEGVLSMDGKPCGIGRVVRPDNTIEEGVFSADLTPKVLFRQILSNGQILTEG